MALLSLVNLPWRLFILILKSINRNSSSLSWLKECPNNFLLLHPGASLSKDKKPKIGILKIGKFRRVLLLVSFELPINHVVQSLPGVGAKSPNLNLNNDVLQEVRVPLELSKVPLIPPDPTSGSRSTGLFPSQLEVSRGPSFCYQDPGIWTSTSNRFSSNSFIQGSFDKQPVFFPREECSSLRSCCGYAAQRSNPGGQGFFIPGFLQQTFPCGKEDWRMEASNRFESFKSLSGLPTFRMETTQSIRNSLQVGQWTTSLDLKDAYFHIPMAPSVHKLHRFQVLGKLYQFVAMPFGLATAPREFTTLVKEVKRMALR